MNLRKQISSSIRRHLLEEGYRTSLSENTGLKNVWMRKFQDVVKSKNPEVTSQKGFWDAADILYSKGMPAVDAAEQMFIQRPVSNPSQIGSTQGTGGWAHK